MSDNKTGSVSNPFEVNFSLSGFDTEISITKLKKIAFKNIAEKSLCSEKCKKLNICLQAYFFAIIFWLKNFIINLELSSKLFFEEVNVN